MTLALYWLSLTLLAVGGICCYKAVWHASMAQLDARFVRVWADLCEIEQRNRFISEQ